MKKLYAKAKITHGDFRKNNLYLIIETGELFLQLKVADMIVSAKRDNYEIVSCIFNEEKAE